MATNRKSFNFRHGLQVDDTNFVINANGLVGIGSSVPTESLDVRDNVKIGGSLIVGSLEVTNQSSLNGLGVDNIDVGITSIKSGIITSSSPTGIITYYGDARYLQGMPTSQWVDVDAGLGYISIYAAGNVGVGTIDPRFTFQVGGNTDTTESGFTGVGIQSGGHILAAGIATAYSFTGFGTGITGINASNISNGTLDTNRLPATIESSQLDLTGIATAYSFSGFGTDISGINASNISNGTLDNDRLPEYITSTDINITGFMTATTFVGALTGTASTAQSLSGIPDIEVGFATVSTLKLTNNLGIGAEATTANLVIKADYPKLELVSDDVNAQISIGHSLGVGNSSVVISYNTTPYGLQISNNHVGDINMVLHDGTADAYDSVGVDTGSFGWYYGQTSDQIMVLTYDGKLGINETSPIANLHVVGTSSVTQNAYFNNDVQIDGNLIFTGSLASNVNVTEGSSTFNNIEASSLVLDNNLDVSGITSVGLSTVYISSANEFTKVAFGKTTGDQLYGDIDAMNSFLLVGSVGIGTSGIRVLGEEGTYDPPSVESTRTVLLNGASLYLWENHYNYGQADAIYDFSRVGLNTHTPRSIIDFGRCGYASTIGGYFIPPSITTVEREQNTNFVGVGGTVEGAIIYNTTTKKHQGYGSQDNGTTFDWYDLY